MFGRILNKTLAAGVLNKGVPKAKEYYQCINIC